MSFNAECVTCKNLGRCADTSSEKVLGHFVCYKFEEVEKPDAVRARCDVINKYGEAGLHALITPHRTVEEA